MVAVIRGPAERQLRQVAGSDDHAADVVRYVHEDLCPLAGLGVLISDVVVCLIMSNIDKMLPDACFYIDLKKIGAHCPGHRAGIVVGAVRGSEAGHGDSIYIPAGEFQHVEGFGSDQKRKRGIESAGNSDHGLFAPRGFHPLSKSQSLYGKYLLTPDRAILIPGRNKG